MVASCWAEASPPCWDSQCVVVLLLLLLALLMAATLATAPTRLHQRHPVDSIDSCAFEMDKRGRWAAVAYRETSTRTVVGASVLVASAVGRSERAAKRNMMTQNVYAVYMIVRT